MTRSHNYKNAFQKRLKYQRKVKCGKTEPVNRYTRPPSEEETTSGSNGSKEDSEESVRLTEDLASFRPILASSPIPFDEGSDNDTCSYQSDCSDDDDVLYEGCLTSVSEFTDKFNTISSKHQLSDAAKSDYLNLIADILPLPNRCPNLINIKDKDVPYEKLSVEGGDIYTMSLQKQVCSILQKFPDSITLKKCDHDNSVICDIVDGHVFPEVKPNTIYLIMNTDGLSPILSRRLQIWPIIFSIVNLPLSHRNIFSNLILAGIFVGNGKPDWAPFLRSVRNKLSCGVMFNGNFLRFQVVALTADMPAKASVMNIQSFNAKYGCSLCLVEGSYSSTLKKMVYPLQESYVLRTPDMYDIHLRSGTSESPTYGVKGPTELSLFLTLPSCLAYDIMHLAYLGISKNLLTATINKRLADIGLLSDIIDCVQVPHDFRRKPRKLVGEYSLWKAQEHRNFLLYIGPFVFLLLNQRPSDSAFGKLASLFHTLGVLIYVLSSETVSMASVNLCRQLVTLFQQDLVALFGSAVSTMTTHALYHLPDQVIKMGPLSVTSAAAFENLNRHMKRSITGTKGQAHQILSRFLISQRVSHSTIHVEHPHHLGRVKELTSLMTAVSTNVPSPCRGYVDRFYSNGKVFHSFHYGRKLKSASYYAFLSVPGSFVKIKYIFLSSNYVVHCICRKFENVRKVHRDLSLLEGTSRILETISPFYILSKRDIVCFQANLFTHHAIVHKSPNTCYRYGVRILKNFEHE